MRMSKSIIKLALIIFMLSTLIIGTKQFSSYWIGNNSDFSEILKQIEESKDTSFYFIGSSRVRANINTTIIKDYFEKQAFNCGVNASTFLSNCLLANFLIQDQKPKVIIIELALFKTNLPKAFFNFSDAANFDFLSNINLLMRQESLLNQIPIILQVYSHYFAEKILIGSEARKIIGLYREEVNPMGAVARHNQYYDSNAPFLTYEELEEYKNFYSQVTLQENMSQTLSQIAVQNNAKVKFILPISYNNEQEKKVLIPIYHALPDSLKITYPKAFFTEINKAQYLADNIHLNSKGADKHTQLLCPLLKRELKK